MPYDDVLHLINCKQAQCLTLFVLYVVGPCGSGQVVVEQSNDGSDSVFGDFRVADGNSLS